MRNAMELYHETVKGMLEDAFSCQKEQMETASRKIAECIMNGGMVYTFGTGHGHLLALEIFYRAGGLVRVCPILDERLLLHVSASESSEWERKTGIAEELLKKYPVRQGDILIDISNSGRNTVPVELAALCRERGVFVIALTSLSHSKAVSPRNRLGLRLFEAADLVLDNRGVLGDACVPGTNGRMVGPTSTVIGAALLQSLICRAEEISRQQGKPTEFFASSNIDGGDEINSRYIEAYKSIIPGL